MNNGYSGCSQYPSPFSNATRALSLISSVFTRFGSTSMSKCLTLVSFSEFLSVKWNTRIVSSTRNALFKFRKQKVVGFLQLFRQMVLQFDSPTNLDLVYLAFESTNVQQKINVKFNCQNGFCNSHSTCLILSITQPISISSCLKHRACANTCHDVFSLQDLPMHSLALLCY